MKRVLFVNPFGIGDSIFTLTAVEAFRRARPDAYIGFVANERTRALVEMDKSIDRTFTFHRDLLRRLWRRHPLMGIKHLRRLVGSIRQERFDTLYDFSLGREYALAGLFAGIGRRVGLDYRGRGLFLTQRVRLEGYEGRHVADTQLDLLERAGVPVKRGSAKLSLHVSPENHAEAAGLLKRAGIGASEPVLAVAPGGGKTWGVNAVYKQWDAGKFAAAAAEYAKPRAAAVVLLGDRQEAALLESVAASLPGKRALFSGERLGVVCALLQRSKALLCNDGGLLHLANALGVPTVSLFGPVDDRAYGPYGEDTRHKTLTADVPCRPCYSRFRFPPCPHERRCLTQIEPARAASALANIA